VSCNASDFTIGGTVLDLEGSGLVLRNNASDELRIDSDGRFTFDTALPVGSTYNVTITEQPRDPEQTCNVANGSGVVGTSNISNVTVRCSSSPPTGGRFEVGGHVSELRGSGLILQNNGGDDLAIGSNGSFAFATRLPTGGAYNVTILRQPTKPTQTCTIENGSGIIGDSKIMNVEVTCRGGHHQQASQEAADS
jgi:trimeric autotransporter adhesin